MVGDVDGTFDGISEGAELGDWVITGAVVGLGVIAGAKVGDVDGASDG